MPTRKMMCSDIYKCLVLFIVNFSLIGAVPKENCVTCIFKDKCALFGSMSRKEQEEWVDRYSCQNTVKEKNDFNDLFGFAPAAKGDYVCCPSTNLDTPNRQSDGGIQFTQDNFANQQPDQYNRRHNGPIDSTNNFISTTTDDPGSQDINEQYDDNEEKYSQHRRPLGYGSANRRSQQIQRPYQPRTENPYFMSRPNNQGQGYNRPSGSGQCTMTSLPPTPDTGCCGRDEAADRIIGGKRTELGQFPWLALLKTIFNYGNRESAFSCGGSIISAKYILTAAHCVVEEGARVSKVDVYLAEYDKRTFPMDCVETFEEGKRCVENIIMQAENVVPHPGYDDSKLQNDIALIRLRGSAPYTEFIRPICLPPIDIDTPNFSNLRVAVAGWGRDGQYTSDVKQSTVVNLVEQRDCKRHYPFLTRRHLCAAGYTGEDTCKGDSGGPLMMLYEGKYYVSGVVSGKRADSPCGTSVPSLYTNVYHYLDWIRNNMRQ